MLPYVNHLIVPLAVRDDPPGILLLDLLHFNRGFRHQIVFLLRDHHIVYTDRNPGEGGILESQVLQVIHEAHGFHISEFSMNLGDDGLNLFLVQKVVDKRMALRKNLVEQKPSDRSLHPLAIETYQNVAMEAKFVTVVSEQGFLGIGEALSGSRASASHFRQIIAAQRNVLGFVHHDRLPIGREKQIIRGRHQHLSLDLRLKGERKMHGHLIPVEVRIKGRAHHRMDPNGLPFHQNRLKGLNTQTVQCGRTI